MLKGKLVKQTATEVLQQVRGMQGRKRCPRARGWGKCVQGMEL